MKRGGQLRAARGCLKSSAVGSLAPADGVRKHLRPGNAPAEDPQSSCKARNLFSSHQPGWNNFIMHKERLRRLLSQ